MDSEERRYQMWLSEQKDDEVDAAELQKREDEFDPTLGMSMYDKVMAGIFGGMKSGAMNAGNMIGLVDDSSIADMDSLHAPLANTGAGKAGMMIGETALAAPVAAVAASPVGAVVGAAAPRLAPMARYLTEGALEGAVFSKPNERLQGAAIGGAASGALGGVVGRGIHGIEPTPNAQTLMDEGVRLTPGQMRPQGIMNAMEQSAFSRMTPSVKMARDESSLDVFGALINRSLPPGGTAVDVTNISDMTDALYDQFRHNYDQVQDFPVNTMGLTRQMNERIGRSASTADIQQSDVRWLEGKMSVIDAADPAELRTSDLLNLRSKIRERMRDLRNTNSFRPDDIESLTGIEEAVSQRIRRALPFDMRRLLDETDAQYGNYKVIEDISYRAGDADAVTPFKMSQAVKMNRSLSKGQYARGGADDLRDITRPAMDVLGTTTPPTGMSLAIPGLMSGMGATLGGAAAGPGGLVGAALPSVISALGAGTQSGRNAFLGATLPQEVLQNIGSIPILPEFMRGMGANISEDIYNN